MTTFMQTSQKQILSTTGNDAESITAVDGSEQQLKTSPFTQLEREAQLDVFSGATEPEQTKVAVAGLLRNKITSLARAGSRTFIIAGIVAIALAALFIWPGAVAVRQSKKLKRYEQRERANRPSTTTALVIAILTVVLGALGMLMALGSFVVGFGALSVGALLSVAMVVVGIIATRRLSQQSEVNDYDPVPQKKAGGVSHAASALWITAITLSLLIPGIASVTIGSMLKKKFSA